MSIYTNYFEWEMKDKVSFWDNEFEEKSVLYADKDTVRFIENVIMDKSEKVFFKVRALQELLIMVHKNKLSQSKFISFILDDWDQKQDSTLECLRLKYLVLFIEKEKEEIKKILDSKVKDKNYEIKSEAGYQLGLIKLLEANEFYHEQDYKQSINEAIDLFDLSIDNDENRIDAQILKMISMYLAESITSKLYNTEGLYKGIMSLTWENIIYSSDYCKSKVYIGIVRCISKIEIMKSQNTDKWLDYRKEFKSLCYHFYELQNADYKSEFPQYKIVENIKQNLIKYSLEPIFKYNYKSIIMKIDIRLSEEISDEERKFLEYLKELILNDKVNESNVNLRFMKKMFPRITEEDIERFKNEIQGPNKDIAIYNLLESTQRYSYNNLLEEIITACTRLQGNHMYRNASEDDRNGYIRDILDSVGYSTKDQTRWGKSKSGKSSGEIDIMIYNDTAPYSIIEAMNLNSLKREYINTHIDKVFGYDTTGLPCNYVISYAEVKNFDEFWENYKEHIKTHKYPYEITGFDESLNKEFCYSDIKIAITEHSRSGNTVKLYHIGVRISY